MRPTSTPKIEHEDNFFIEIDFCSTQILKRFHKFGTWTNQNIGWLQIYEILIRLLSIDWIFQLCNSLASRANRTSAKPQFWPTKKIVMIWESIPRWTCRCHDLGIDPTMNMSGPPPTGAGYNFCRSCSIELQTWYGKLRSDYYCSHYYSPFNRGGPGFSCATPLLKYVTGFNL